MICFQLSSTVSYLQTDITDLNVDAIINFVDIKQFKKDFDIMKKGGTRVSIPFEEKWNKNNPNFNDILITEGGNLKCKSIIHTTSLSFKPNNVGYYDAIQSQINVCVLKAEQEKYKSLALYIIHKDNIQDLILQAYHDFFSSYKRHIKIFLVCKDKELFETIQKKFSNELTECKMSLEPETATDSGRIEQSSSDAMASGTTDSANDCSICLCDITDKKTLDKCGHSFCSTCIETSFSQSGPFCPNCLTIYGQIIGQQPPGKMLVTKKERSLPGFPGCGMYELEYEIPDGIQQEDHPNPGKRFSGTMRVAYLPANKEGKTVLKMLQKAFLQKLIFTVGVSRTTNISNTVIWNDIHHKTSINGGFSNFGYPDSNYLKRVTLELASKGVYATSVAHEKIQFTLESK